MEKKKRVGVSTELYEIYLKETSKEARRTRFEAMYWEEEEIEKALKKRVSFNDFVMGYIKDFESLVEENQRLQNVVNDYHPSFCKCNLCEEERADWRRSEAERRAEEELADEEW